MDEVIAGEISISKGLNESVIDELIEAGKEEGFELKKRKIILKEGLGQIPPEVWIFFGSAVGNWLIGKFLDTLWEKLKALVKKTHLAAGVGPIINIKGNKNLIINFNLKDPSNLDDAFGKLIPYLKENIVEGWQWYNEEEREWGDINKVMKWKRKKKIVEERLK